MRAYALIESTLGALGPVALGARQIEDDWLLFLHGIEFTFDGGEGAEKQTAGVGHDGAAAGRDLVGREEFVEFAEDMVDVLRGAELVDTTDEFGGQVFEVARRGRERETSGDLPVVVPKAEARPCRPAGQTATSPIGITIVAARRILEGLGRATPPLPTSTSSPEDR